MNHMVLCSIRKSPSYSRPPTNLSKLLIILLVLSILLMAWIMAATLSLSPFLQIVCGKYCVLVEVIKEKSIQEKEVATVVEEDGPTWMTPVMEYLKDGTIPDNRKEESKLHIKTRQYELLEGVLCRRSFLKPWIRYVGPLQADYVIREIHEGLCSMHAGPRSVVAKAMRMPTYRTSVVDAVHNDEELRLNLDLLEERRERAAIREANAKLKMTNYYNARVQGVTFRLGDFVYRSNEANHAVGEGSLAQNRKDLMRSRNHSETEYTV
nr:reverse transcriptase domain-containing protein [Tanacetum cinerariifolium]GFA07084.1 reverse transcriptase domain-containing protein [Tanacetum cinerariifolium]